MRYTSGQGQSDPGATAFDAARALLALPDFPGSNEAREERLRVVLDQLALAYDGLEQTPCDEAFADPARADYNVTRARFAAAFPGLGYYHAVDPATLALDPQPEVTMGDALDDLTDIALDMQEALDRASASSEDAIWHFRFGFESHWGRHLRWLQLVLHERRPRRA